MALNQDFIVRSGIQINTNLVVGSYWLTNAAPVNGAIISGNVGIGTATPSKELTVQNDLSATTYYADLGVPNINPTLSMSFVNQTSKLDTRVAFTRASNATVTTSTGNIAIISNNVPAFDYDPVTLKPNGLRIESSRTNLMNYCINMTGGSWFTVNTTVYTSNVYSPDGTLNASNIVVTGTGGGDTGYIDGNYAITVGGTTFYSNSVFVKKGNTDVIDVYTFYTGSATRASNLRYTFSTNTVVAGVNEGPGVYPITYGSTVYPNGWVRLYWSTYDNLGTNNLSKMRLYVGTRASVTTGSYIYYWGAQGEAGIYPTSFIYNNKTGSTTRAADIATMPISAWFNPQQGTFRVTAQVPYLIDTLYQATAEIYNASTLNSQLIVSRYNVNGTPQVSAVVGDANGYTVSNQISNIWPNAAIGTTTVSYNTSSGVYSSAFNSAVFGATVNTTPIWNTVAPNTLNLGNRAGNSRFLDGWIRNLSYYPASQTNSAVQSFSFP